MSARAVAALLALTAASASVLELEEASFDAATSGGGKGPMIVEFYAPWCGHCQRLLPRFEAASARAAGVRWAKVETDANPALRERFGVTSFPTILAFADGDFAPAAAREYAGPRSTEALVDLAARLTRPAVLPLDAGAGGSGGLLAWARATGSEGGVAFVLVDDEEASGAGAGAGADAALLRRAFGLAAQELRYSLTFGAFSSAAAGAAALRAALGARAEALLTGAAPPFVMRIEAGEPGAAQLLAAPQLRAMAAALAAGGGGGGGAEPVYRVKAAARRAVAGAEARAAAEAAAAGDAAGAAEALRGWAIHHKYPTVLVLGAENFAYAANNGEGRYVALVCHPAAEVPAASLSGAGEAAAAAAAADPEASPAPSPAAVALRMLQRLASPASSGLPRAVRDRFIFGRLEQEPFAAFLEQFGVRSCPQLLVVDTSNKAFWTDATVVEETDMETFLTDVAEGRAPMQKQGLMATPQRIVNATGKPVAYALAALAVLGLLYALWSLVIAEALGLKGAERSEAKGKVAAAAASTAAAAAPAAAAPAAPAAAPVAAAMEGSESPASAMRRRNAAPPAAAVDALPEGGAAVDASAATDAKTE